MSTQSTAPSPLPSHPSLSPQSNIQKFAKHKERSHSTYHNIHLPELNVRLSLNLPLPEPTSPTQNDPFAPHPDLSNAREISVVYLGNSMLERLKTTGKETQLAKLQTSWNAGCGGDKSENVAFRFGLGMHGILKQYCSTTIKVWVLASGTNNLHHKRPFRDADIEAYRVLVEACVDIAPDSVVLACDMFYRKDVPDEIVDKSNQMLENVVREVNEGLGKEKARWIEAREKIGKELLVDHVHMNEEGYRVWDRILWPYVGDILNIGADEKDK